MINRYKQWFTSLLPHTKALVWIVWITGVLSIMDLIGIWIFNLS